MPEAWGDHFSSVGDPAGFALTQRRSQEVSVAESPGRETCTVE